MLVTDPASRATLTEVLSSPWMVKGYDGPPDTHLVQREPLRADELDPEVLRGMAGFEFGTADAIEERLKEILTSEAYKNVLSSWDSRRDAARKGRGWSAQQGGAELQGVISRGSSDLSSPGKKKDQNKRFSGLDFYRKKLFAPTTTGGRDDRGRSSSSEDLGSMSGLEQPRGKEPLDPTRGFHPLISIYYLVREKVEREKVYGNSHFASSQFSLEEANKIAEEANDVRQPAKAAAADFSMAVPRLPVPESSYVSESTYDSSPLPQIPSSYSAPSPSQGVPRAKAQDQPFSHLEPPSPVKQKQAAAAAGIMQHPEQDFDRSQLDDLSSGPASGGHRRSQSLLARGGNLPVPFPAPGLAPQTGSIKEDQSSRSAATAPPDLDSPMRVEDDELALLPPSPRQNTEGSPGLTRRFGSLLGKKSPRGSPSAEHPPSMMSPDYESPHKRTATTIPSTMRPPKAVAVSDSFGPTRKLNPQGISGGIPSKVSGNKKRMGRNQGYSEPGDVDSQLRGERQSGTEALTPKSVFLQGIFR